MSARLDKVLPARVHAVLGARLCAALGALLCVLAVAALAPALARGEGLSDDGGAEWRVEQPAAPAAGTGVEGTDFPIGLGRIGDIEFWAPDRGALITAGNGSTVPAGVWIYNGESWHELATVCGASDGRIVWASEEEFWTISDGRTGQAVNSRGESPPIVDDTLCRFALNREHGQWEIADSYATIGFRSTSYQAMNAAACIDPSDCWFGGEPLPEPQIGAFQLHWNGRTLTPEPFLPEGHAVESMAAFEGRLAEGVRLLASDKRVSSSLELPALRFINPEGVAPTFEPVAQLPLYAPGEFPYALDYLHLSSDGDALWGAAGPQLEAPSGSKEAGVTLLRYSKLQYSGETHEYEEEALPSWSEVVGPCPSAERACEADTPNENPLLGYTVSSIAGEPSTHSAWVALRTLGEAAFGVLPNDAPTVARVSADGTISDELKLAAKGPAETIVCPATHDCWLTTAEGWLFHLDTEAEHEHPEVNAEAAFAGGYLLSERPRDESVPQQVPLTLPEEEAGPEVQQSGQKASIQPETVNPFAKVTLPLMSNMHTRLVHGTTLEFRFHLSVKASVRLVAKRKSRVVASTAKHTFKAGNHSLSLRLNVHAWPTKLALQTHALAPLKTVSTRESGSQTDVVSTSLSFPDTRALLGSGLLP